MKPSQGFILALGRGGPNFLRVLQSRGLSSLYFVILNDFVVVSNVYAAGDLTFDRSLPVEEARANNNSSVAGYFRSMNVLGRSGHFTVVVPDSSGAVQGLLAGEYTQVSPRPPQFGLERPAIRADVDTHWGQRSSPWLRGGNTFRGPGP